MDSLPALTQLTDLRVECHLTSGFGALKSCESLTSLRLDLRQNSGTVDHELVDTLQAMAHLRKLTLQSDSMGIMLLRLLASASPVIRLESLCLIRTWSDAVFPLINGRPLFAGFCETLVEQRVELSRNPLSSLNGLDRLQTLDLTLRRPSGTAFESMDMLPSLTSLCVKSGNMKEAYDTQWIPQMLLRTPMITALTLQKLGIGFLQHLLTPSLQQQLKVLRLRDLHPLPAEDFEALFTLRSLCTLEVRTSFWTPPDPAVIASFEVPSARMPLLREFSFIPRHF